MSVAELDAFLASERARRASAAAPVIETDATTGPSEAEAGEP
jgi:hypothetical protein